MPDVAVAYQLHLECGKLINLHDWLQARRIVDQARSSITFPRSPHSVFRGSGGASAGWQRRGEWGRGGGCD